MTCKKCHEVHAVKNGVRFGRQRCRCSVCGHEWLDSDKADTGNVLCISDLHFPHAHKNALKFCKDIYDEHECNEVVLLGDVFDSAGWSQYLRDPDGVSSAQEVRQAKEDVKPWVEAFPVAKVAIGNHSLRMNKRMQEAGLPKEFVKSFNEVWGLPETWDWKMEHIIHGVRYIHGPRFGKHVYAAYPTEFMQSVVCAHTHSHAGIHFYATDDVLVWGMNVGCLIDTKSRAFLYGQDYTSRPIIAAGVVKNFGRQPVLIPMNLQRAA